jgi:two-component system response regulator HydG
VVGASHRPGVARSVTFKPRVLIVDDDLDTSNQLSTLLDRDGYTCERAGNGLEALQAVARQPFDVVVSDIRMDGMNGLDLLDRLNKIHPKLPVILCTGFSNIAGAVDATKRGAFQYIVKPYDLSALEEIMTSAVGERRVADLSTNGESKLHLARPRGKSLQGPLDAASTPLLLGVDPAMLVLQQSIASVAASSAPVLIVGESGTGKDLVARAIHAAGSRRDHAFVAVNVSAIPEHLLESELFGHVRGAFTGASEARRGLLVEAHGGTLFLDEIGDMPIGLQAKLLRVLQFGEVRPVGSDSARGVDVRIVSATHRDLPKLIASDRFREDLYFRLRVLPIDVPPLRERRGDIVGLARHFLKGAQRRTPTSPVITLGADAERILSIAAWPGNVRELESTMERLVVFGKEATIQAGDLYFLSQDLPVVIERTDHASLREVSERHVAQILLSTNGDKRRAAEILGIDLSTLYRWKQRKPTY